MHQVDLREISQHLFNESNDALLITDPDDHRVLKANPTVQRLTGLRKKQLVEMKLGELVIGIDAEATMNLLDACQSTCFFHSNEGYYLRRQ